MKTLLTLVTAALIAATAGPALAKDGPKMKGAHGASYNAPGHVKKRLGLQSARSVAPGHTKPMYLRVR